MSSEPIPACKTSDILMTKGRERPILYIKNVIERVLHNQQNKQTSTKLKNIFDKMWHFHSALFKYSAPTTLQNKELVKIDKISHIRVNVSVQSFVYTRD